MDLTARLDLGELHLRTLSPNDADLLVAAVGLMLDSPQSAELAYWYGPSGGDRASACAACGP
jgi:hypothetical protein